MQRILFIFLILCCTFEPLYSQQADDTFGKSRLRYKTFNWLHYSTENFEVYFYQNGKDNAKMVAKFLEVEYERISDLIGYSPYGKSRIFLYNSKADLQQSNVGLEREEFNNGGQTVFVRLQTEVANPGTKDEFRRDIRRALAEMLVKDMMYGGSLTDVFQSSYLLNLPEWFISGVSAYVAEGWSIEMDDEIRDLMSQESIERLNKYSGKEAELIGHSIWNYISKNYGRRNISNILNLTRIIRNEENSIANTLGISFRRFMYGWRAFYLQDLDQVKSSFDEIDHDLRISKNKNRKDHIHRQVRFSPSGEFVAYTSYYNGQYSVWVKNIATGKKKKVFSGGAALIQQKPNEDIPIIAWQENTRLGIVHIKNGENRLTIVNTRGKKFDEFSLDRFEQIQSISFADGGALAVISASDNRNTDIYLFSLRRNAVKRLTNDPFDNIDATFIPNTGTILFSSNRSTDSLAVKDRPDLFEYSEDYNIFTFNIDTTKTVVNRIINMQSNNVRPVPIDNQSFYYLSDQKGIVNLVNYDFNTKTTKEVSQFRSSIRDFDIHEDMLAFISYNKGGEYVYLYPEFDFSKGVFPPQTRRQQERQLAFLKNRIERRNTENINKASELSVEPDKVVKLSERDRREFQEQQRKASSKDEQDESSENGSDTPPSLIDDFLGLEDLEEENDDIAIEDSPQDTTPKVPEEEVDRPSIEEEEETEGGFPEPLSIEEIESIERQDELSLIDSRFSRVDSIPNTSASSTTKEEKGEDWINPEEYTFDYTSRPSQSNRDLQQAIDNRVGGDEDMTGYIDTESFLFDRENLQSTQAQRSSETLLRYRQIEKQRSIYGPTAYERSFMADNLTTGIYIHPIMGLGLNLQVDMNDMLEQHRFSGGILGFFDLRSGIINANYRYQKERVEWLASYNRKAFHLTVQEQNFNIPERYTFDEFEIGVSVPITNASRIELKPFFAALTYQDQDLSTIPSGIESVSLSQNYIGGRAEYIFDNSKMLGLNIMSGSRGRIGFEHYNGINEEAFTFSRFTVDLRHYQPVHKEIIFATRAFYGVSFGQNPQDFALGGMDNWYFNHTDNRQTNDPLMPQRGVANPEIMFTRFVTNLRGYNYNRLNGHNSLLFNAELRVPIVKYLYSGPLASNFVRNLKLVTFFDMGSAWTGGSPFDEENDINTEFFEPGGNFTYELRNFSSPWLMSYGLGMRTVALGYYGKLDVAWPLEDFSFSGPTFQLTLGFDF
ncbi:MAG: hypothetical protein LAT68_04290 [Cyclobacteriaceae bacterium]|nr:PD40 domain-containing protein [Cyclobacteriaceae bacterium]MCH8515529.1 hypothetical protein [Cyclobacteriaceae bacterium]